MDKHAAFSLLELLVVMAILAILAIGGSIIYAQYLVRSQISEGLRVLEEYKVTAAALRARNGTITPYDVLFSDSNLAGFVSGTPGGTSAVKTVGLKYVDTITAYSGTDGSGNTYILLGAGLNHTEQIVSGADHVYVAGIQTPAGLFTWQCGASASRSDTVLSEFLPQACQDSLP